MGSARRGPYHRRASRNATAPARCTYEPRAAPSSAEHFSRRFCRMAPLTSRGQVIRIVAQHRVAAVRDDVIHLHLVDCQRLAAVCAHQVLFWVAFEKALSNPSPRASVVPFLKACFDLSNLARMLRATASCHLVRAIRCVAISKRSVRHLRSDENAVVPLNALHACRFVEYRQLPTDQSLVCIASLLAFHSTSENRIDRPRRRALGTVPRNLHTCGSMIPTTSRDSARGHWRPNR